jgi:hypothetical protein
MLSSIGLGFAFAGHCLGCSWWRLLFAGVGASANVVLTRTMLLQASRLPNLTKVEIPDICVPEGTPFRVIKEREHARITNAHRVADS